MKQFVSYEQALDLLNFATLAKDLRVEDVHKYLNDHPHWELVGEVPAWNQYAGDPKWGIYSNTQYSDVTLNVRRKSPPLHDGTFPEIEAQSILDALANIEEQSHQDTYAQIIR